MFGYSMVCSLSISDSGHSHAAGIACLALIVYHKLVVIHRSYALSVLYPLNFHVVFRFDYHLVLCECVLISASLSVHIRNLET